MQCLQSFSSCRENMRRFVHGLLQNSGREEEAFSVSNEIEIASFHEDKSERQALALQGTEIGIKLCLWSFL